MFLILHISQTMLVEGLMNVQPEQDQVDDSLTYWDSAKFVLRLLSSLVTTSVPSEDSDKRDLGERAKSRCSISLTRFLSAEVTNAFVGISAFVRVHHDVVNTSAISRLFSFHQRLEEFIN